MPSLEQVRRKLGEKCRDNLVLLVGRNPIPNFVAASILQPQTVYMVFTEDTEDVKDRLIKTLQTYVSWNPGIPRFIDVQLVNVFDVDEIQRVVRESIPAGSALHYTGGMKTMAAHVYFFWRKSGGGDPQFASYLDESSGTLWFDDGLSEDVDGAAPLSLEALSDVHGLSDFNARILPDETLIKGYPTIGDAIAIVRAALNDPEGISRLTDGLMRCLNGGRTHGEADSASSIFSGLSYPGPLSITKSTIQSIKDQWSGFIKTHRWLEVFTAHSVAEAGKQIESEGFEHGETHWDVKAETVAGRDFQVDVAHRRGHRLYVLSCTVSNDLKSSKFKLFEVSLRTKQLGGDYARSAVVSFINSSHQQQLQDDVMTAYGPIDEKGNRTVAHIPKVFGVDHIRAWLNGDFSSLKEWMKV